VKKGNKLEIGVERINNAEKVWYEWYFKEGDPNTTTFKHNLGGNFNSIML